MLRKGLLRLGHALGEAGRDYTQAGLTVLRRLLEEPYLSTDPHHEGILLHSVYHRPNGWDAIPAGRKIPCGESSMWGDYHLLEAMLLVTRLAEGSYYTFFQIASTRARRKVEDGEQVALVTGGARGIGFGIALRLAQDGFDLAIAGRRTAEETQSAVDRIREHGVGALSTCRLTWLMAALARACCWRLKSASAGSTCW